MIAKEKISLTSGEASLKILEIITSYKLVNRFIPSTIFPFQHVLSRATHQIQGFLVWLTLPLSPSLIYGKDVATRGPAPVLLSLVEPFSIKALAPAAADKTRVSRCTGMRPRIRPVDGVELEDSHPLVGFNCRPALAWHLKIIHSVWCIQSLSGICLQWKLLSELYKSF